MARLTGYEAIEYAERTGARLSKYADPVEGARDRLTVDEAREVAAEDPSLIYLDEQSYRIESLVSGQDLGVWPGETPEQAIEAMDRAAGYASSDAALEDLGLSPAERRAELLVTPSESAS